MDVMHLDVQRAFLVLSSFSELFLLKLHLLAKSAAAAVAAAAAVVAAEAAAAESAEYAAESVDVVVVAEKRFPAGVGTVVLRGLMPVCSVTAEIVQLGPNFQGGRPRAWLHQLELAMQPSYVAMLQRLLRSVLLLGATAQSRFQLQHSCPPVAEVAAAFSQTRILLPVVLAAACATLQAPVLDCQTRLATGPSWC